MTIPAGAQRNWCPSCGDTCSDDLVAGRICAVCGSQLEYPRVMTTRTMTHLQQVQQAHSLLSAQNRMLGIPEEQLRQAEQHSLVDGTTAAATTAAAIHSTRALLQRAQDMRDVLQRAQDLRERTLQMQQEQQTRAVAQAEEWMSSARQLLQQTAELQHAFQDVVAGNHELLGIGGGGSPPSHRGRPTSASYLNEIPRVVLEPKSSLLYHASFKLLFSGAAAEREGASSLQFQAIPGEFGTATTTSCTTAPNNDHHHHPPVVLEDCRLVIASPRTGKGGVLSEDTCRQIQGGGGASSSSSSLPCVVYFDRGGDVTFVQKALLAQNAGARAVVIGNNQAQPWPYTMKDSKKEALKDGGLHIPVVMVKQADAKEIVAQASSCCNNNLRCQLEIQPNPSECAVCLHTLEVGHTVLSIPACGHVFHETCAMTWLCEHNTCPYCRLELPTEDKEYEQERRRTQRTHAGSSTSAGGTLDHSGNTANDFYR